MADFHRIKLNELQVAIIFVSKINLSGIIRGEILLQNLLTFSFGWVIWASHNHTAL